MWMTEVPAGRCSKVTYWAEFVLLPKTGRWYMHSGYYNILLEMERTVFYNSCILSLCMPRTVLFSGYCILLLCMDHTVLYGYCILLLCAPRTVLPNYRSLCISCTVLSCYCIISLCMYRTVVCWCSIHHNIYTHRTHI